MSDLLTSNSLLMLERSMNFQWTKQRVLLDNIANAETPNYKAKYVTFEDALQDKLQSAVQRPKQPVAAMRGALTSASPTIHTDETETARMDGNGVNIAEQNLEMVRNTYQMQYVLNAINSDLSLLRTAIRGQ